MIAMIKHVKRRRLTDPPQDPELLVLASRAARFAAAKKANGDRWTVHTFFQHCIVASQLSKANGRKSSGQ